MAEIKKGILGGFSGKVGTVIGVNWRGKDIIRSLPKASKKAPTEEQLIQRVKFRKTIDFLQPLRSIQNRYFGNKAGKQSRFNNATSYTLTNAVEMVLDLPVIIVARVLITKGELLDFQLPEIDATTAGTFSFSWEDNSGQGNAKETDLVNVVCYCEELNSFYISEEIATRDTLVASVNLPTPYQNKEVDVWIYLNTEKRTQASTSSYLGKHEVL
ncbi:DUF6266 family protein [Empedobacter sp. UBA7248]|uniref:DUF6266 family protein n=1 Tax=Empedobacter sp. UBA7248 TaxID=1946448 RepID=UPI0025BD7736|nr:DUF6266 family protein [Empedobacter sp. UBA7248]